MSLTKEDVIQYLSGLTILEMAELVSELEEKWGVSAAAAVVAGPADGPKEEEKTEFDVELNEIGKEKIKVIKVVKQVTGLGLKEAKALVEKAPVVIKEALPKDQADELINQLTAAGAVGVLK